GSNTKDFTTVAILQLVEAGKLSLDDSLRRFFPDAPADKAAITVRHLLNHRAGLPLYASNSGGDFEPVSRDTLIARVMRMTLESTPGARERYSNTGYSVLAAIIELVSGNSYDVYVRDNIFERAGMKETGYLLPMF